MCTIVPRGRSTEGLSRAEPAKSELTCKARGVDDVPAANSLFMFQVEVKKEDSSNDKVHLHEAMSYRSPHLPESPLPK